jgi:hypothetical protein
MRFSTAVILIMIILVIFRFRQNEGFRPEARVEAQKLIARKNEFVAGEDTFDQYRKIVKVADVDNYYRTRRILRNCEKKDNCFNEVVNNLN